jgi:hypothetical protein
MTESRYILLVTHTGRLEAVNATQEAIEQLVAAKLTPVMTGEQVIEIQEFQASLASAEAELERSRSEVQRNILGERVLGLAKTK